MADGGDYSFTTDYAKSNRSKCKVCKSGIDKDSVRMAVMVQSPNFDGKVPNWYHCECFFVKNKDRGTTTNRGLTCWTDLHNLMSLRPADQENLRNLIAKHASTPSPSPAKGKPATPSAASRKADQAPSSDGADAPAAKRQKTDQGEAKLASTDDTFERISEDGKLVWLVRDAISSWDLSTIRSILDANHASSNGSDAEVRRRLSEGIVFGARPQCPDCKNWSIGVGNGVYECRQFSTWGKCLWASDSIPTTPWFFDGRDDLAKQLPQEVQAFLQTPRKRTLAVSRRADGNEAVGGGEEEEENTASALPLDGLKFYLLGVPTIAGLDSHDAVTKKVADLGGRLLKTFTAGVSALLGQKDQVDNSSTQSTKFQNDLRKATKQDLPVLDVEEVLDGSRDWKATANGGGSKLWIAGSDASRSQLASFLQAYAKPQAASNSTSSASSSS